MMCIQKTEFFAEKKKKEKKALFEHYSTIGHSAQFTQNWSLKRTLTYTFLLVTWLKFREVSLQSELHGSKSRIQREVLQG